MTAVAAVEVLNGDQTVVFDGELLGQASSELGYRDDRRDRWSVVQIYRASEGKYVVVKIGKSRVVHASQRCRVLRSNIDPPEEIDLRSFDTSLIVACDRCHPNLISGPVFLERDHSSAVVADKASGAVAACYSRDQNGLWFLSHNSEDALRDAFEHDRQLESAFMRFDPTTLGRRKS